MFCRNCGAPLEGDDVFCSVCGTPVAQTPPPEPVGYPQQAAYTVQQPEYGAVQEAVASQQSRKKSRRQLLLGGIAVVVIIGAFLGFRLLSVSAITVEDAYIHYVAGRYDLAIEGLAPAVDSGLRDADALAILADSYLRTDDLQNALKAYELLLAEDLTEATGKQAEALRETLAKRTQ